MKITFAFLLLLTLALPACKKPEDRNCFKFTGDQSSVSYPLNDFKHLDCFGNFNLNLYQDTVNQVIIRGGENLISRIELTQTNDTLYLRNRNKCRFLRSYDQEVTIDLHYKDLDYFYYDGGDTARFMNPLKTSYFRFRMRDGGGTVYLNLDTDYADINLESGSGDIHVKGQSFYSRIFVNSTGFLYGDSLSSTSIDALNHGVGDLRCNADSAVFYASIVHAGNILYSGTPDSISLNKPGSGELIKINP